MVGVAEFMVSVMRQSSWLELTLTPMVGITEFLVGVAEFMVGAAESMVSASCSWTPSSLQCCGTIKGAACMKVGTRERCFPYRPCRREHAGVMGLFKNPPRNTDNCSIPGTILFLSARVIGL
jgi:hypothetical protein